MDDKLKRTIGNQLWECRVKKGWTQAFVSEFQLELFQEWKMVQGYLKHY